MTETQGAVTVAGYHWIDSGLVGRLAHLVADPPKQAGESGKYTGCSRCSRMQVGVFSRSAPLARACAMCLDLITQDRREAEAKMLVTKKKRGARDNR